MHVFEIHTHKASSQIDFITCRSNGLTIKVIPPAIQPDEYNEDQAIISAHFYGRLTDDTVNMEIDLVYDFEILPATNVEHELRLPLFYAAIEYYCTQILKKEPDSLTHDGPAFYAFEDSCVKVVSKESDAINDDDKLPF